MVLNHKILVVALRNIIRSDTEDIFYHGTDGKNLKNILKDGFIKVPTEELLIEKYGTTKDEGTAVPVKGRVYVTKDLGYALMYAIGANMVGEKSSGSRLHKKGGIVIVKPTTPLYPDEDWVGDKFLSPYYDNKFDDKIYKLIKNALEECNPHLLEEIEDLQYNDDDGRYAYLSADNHTTFGKKIIHCLEDLDPETMAEVASHAPNLSHAGDLKVEEAWAFDVKTINPKLKKDGSNFFDLATRIDK